MLVHNTREGLVGGEGVDPPPPPKGFDPLPTHRVPTLILFEDNHFWLIDLKI